MEQIKSDKTSNTEIVDELRKVIRRLDTQEKTIDLIYKDRNILEDILSRMTAIENAMHLQRATATENAKDIRTNIEEVKDVVEAKVGEVSETMDGKTVIVKSPRESVIQKIVGKIKGR